MSDYETITLGSVDEMTPEDAAIALVALKGKAIENGWTVETKYNKLIDDRGNIWVAKIGVQGYVPLFAGTDPDSELKAFLKAFESAMQARGTKS